MAKERGLRFRVLAIGVTVAAAFLVLSVSFVAYPAVRARYLFNQVESLQPGRSTYEDAKALAGKIGATPYGPCSPAACIWTVRMDNARIPQWWRGKGEAFVVGYDVKNARVVRKNYGYGVGILAYNFFPSSVGVQELENWGRRDKPKPAAEAGWYSTDLYSFWEFRATLTPGASAQDRRRYTAFNLSCMWKYRGCKDGRDLLPIAASMPASQP